MAIKYCSCCTHPSTILKRRSKPPMEMVLLADGTTKACPGCDGGAVNTAIRGAWNREETDNG